MQRIHGFYSTLAASSLVKKLEGIGRANQIDYHICDHERIEGELLKSSTGIGLATRYFPLSMKRWQQENPRPAKLFSAPEELKCEACGKNLLDPMSGIVVLLETYDRAQQEKQEYVDVYFCCKGYCDEVLAKKYSIPGLIDSWEDIPDITIPTVYLKWVMTLLNQHRAGVSYTEKAFTAVRKLLIALFPYVSREPTSEEKKRLSTLEAIP